MNRELIAIDEAFQRLAEASSIDEIKTIRDKAEAARTFARNAQLGLEVCNRVAEIKLRAERKAGQLLRTLSIRGGDRRSSGHRNRLKLEDVGITQNQSKRWQLEASLSDRDFEEFLSRANADGVEISSASLLRLARSLRTKNRATKRSRSQGSDEEWQPELCELCGWFNEANESLGNLRQHGAAISNILESLTGQLPTKRQMQLLRYYVSELDESIAALEINLLTLRNAVETHSDDAEHQPSGEVT